jgi:hypothetical protein
LANEGHAQSVVAEGGSEQEVSGVDVMVVVGQVMVQLVGLLVLGLGDVSREHRSGLKGDIDHHLEHVDGIILKAVAFEVDRLLIVEHLHVTARHLDHAIVNSLVGVLESLQVCVFKGKQGAAGFFGFVSRANADEEAYRN